MLEEAFEGQIILARYDKAPLPASINAELERRISAKPMTESELEKTINDVAVPSMFRCRN